MKKKKFILTISCQDSIGIVAAITNVLAKQGCFVFSSDQFSDLDTKQFFMRLVFDCEEIEPIQASLEELGKTYLWHIHIQDTEYKPKVVLLVSKQSHCLSDILNKKMEGQLQIEIPAIISNHENLREMASWYKIPFFYLPVTNETKQEQEQKILQIVRETKADLVVLAKYMQILSEELCKELEGIAINIHHSFLPSFKGGKPYHQAHARGVKLIGATGHYVTSDLDEGPIICQEVIRVNHRYSVEDYVRYGSDVEALVLSRCIKYFIERKILLNGNKTVVFR
ncbi:MAG: formyltetrahydrofolate deformylase [Chlamydiae bacterium]|nr:formyltetrahydrofolate deformylase [Chlamydiota bacterium]